MSDIGITFMLMLFVFLVLEFFLIRFILARFRKTKRTWAHTQIALAAWFLATATLLFVIPVVWVFAIKWFFS